VGSNVDEKERQENRGNEAAYRLSMRRNRKRRVFKDRIDSQADEMGLDTQIPYGNNAYPLLILAEKASKL
jgi:hypothetical protein